MSIFNTRRTTPEEIASTWMVELLERVADSSTEERTKAKGKIREYQKLYLVDSLTTAQVDFLVHKIVTKFMFISEDTELVKSLEKWARKVKLKIKLEDIALDSIIAGGAWSEPLTSSISIEGIKVINPESMDYIRKPDGNVELDNEGKPLGYEQSDYGSKKYWYKDRIESNGQVIYRAKKGEDLRDRIRYFKLKSFGDSELGLSMIQPIYRAAIIRTNLEDMVGESAFRGGGIIAYVNGNPGEATKNKLKEDLRNITSRNVFCLDDRIKLATVPIPELTARENLMYLLADFQSSGLGIPLDILISGGKAYKQDLTSKMADLENRIASLQERLAVQVEEYLINPLLKIWKKEALVSFRFVGSSPASQLNRARVIATLARRTLMRYDPGLELQLRKELDLDYSMVQKELERWQIEGRPPEEPKEKRDVPDVEQSDQK